ncbi:MAG: zinc ribbon domain-containing protein [Clostridiales bacterium]|nr:zinc ribbon domain-containing protein [Clostridiales bacterium]
MYCRKCGKEIKDDAKFCPKCGVATKPAGKVSGDTLHETAGAPIKVPAAVSKPPGRINGAAIAIIAAICFIFIVFLGVSANNWVKGTYQARNYPDAASFGSETIDYITFKQFGKAEIGTNAPYGAGSIYKDSTYKIRGGTLVLKAEWNYTDKLEVPYDFYKSGDSIWLDGVEYRNGPVGYPEPEDYDDERQDDYYDAPLTFSDDYGNSVVGWMGDDDYIYTVDTGEIWRFDENGRLEFIGMMH